MQKIYICDDNKIQLIKIKNIIQEEILKQEYNMKIEKCYTSSDELIFDTMESKETNIYFLDVCIESENSGFKTAIEVRNRQPNAFIIFITSHIASISDFTGFAAFFQNHVSSHNFS